MSDKLFIEAITEWEPKKALSLLMGGANPNAKNENKETAIYIALEHLDIDDEESFPEYSELVIELIKRGAVTKSEKFTKLVLESNLPHSVIEEIFDISKIVLPKKKVLSLFLNGESDSDYMIKLIELLERKGYRLDSENMGHAIADSFPEYDHGLGLHGFRYDIKDNLLPVFRYLVDRGADVNVRAAQGHTPLMRAAMNLCPEVCEFLLDNGADANVQSDKGYTALMFASGKIYNICAWENHEEHYEIAKMLVEHGANINLKSKNNRTALSYAKSSNNTKVIELLE